jgi:hypothetical protein
MSFKPRPVNFKPKDRNISNLDVVSGVVMKAKILPYQNSEPYKEYREWMYVQIQSESPSHRRR